MKRSAHLFCALAALLLSGCMFAPGQHLSNSQFEQEPAVDNIRFDLVPITTTLLREQKSVRTTTPVPQELLDYQPEPYRIGPGDVLFVTVWDQPELTSPAGTDGASEVRGRQVRPDGTMFYPYVGELQVGGLTIEELRSLLTQRLVKFIDDPQVDVSVILSFASRRAGSPSRAPSQTPPSKSSPPPPARCCRSSVAQACRNPRPTSASSSCAATARNT